MSLRGPGESNTVSISLAMRLRWQMAEMRNLSAYAVCTRCLAVALAHCKLNIFVTKANVRYLLLLPPTLGADIAVVESPSGQDWWSMLSARSLHRA